MLDSRAFARALADAAFTRAVDTHPGGDGFQAYWTKGEGLAKWAFHSHPWSALYEHIVRHVDNPDKAARITESWFRIVFGIPSGWRKGKNVVGPG